MARKKSRKWIKRIRNVLFLLLVFAIAWYYLGQRYPVRGIDVSHYQGEINWEKVATAGISFAWIKATEGASMKDEMFDANLEGSRKTGIRIGAYHFFRPSVDAKTQARNFLDSYEPEKGDLPPMLDLEVTDKMNAKKIREGVKIWMETVEAEIKVRPVLYTLAKYSDSYLGNAFSGYPLWIVSLRPVWPAMPASHQKWHFWQYSHKGTVDGIKGDVDLNYFSGSESELEALLIQ